MILLRQAPDVEAFLLRRTDALEFAPGACVFPGGSVDELDGDRQIGWAGRSPAEFAELLGTSAERARALVCAAVRETFEESGVLLAGPSPTELVQDSAVLAQDRRALLDGSVSLAELLSRRGLVLRADLLTPWARWVTPEFSPRRFDTWFFAAAMPPGQVPAVTGGSDHERAESVSGSWMRPSDALEAARAGQITLLPPTAVTLAEARGAPGRGQHPGPAPGDHPAAAQGGHRGAAGVARHASSHEVPVVSTGAAGIDGYRTPRATCLLAPNPSPMTLEGTNTWIIAEPGSSSVVVIDPGPDDEQHLRRVHAEAVAGDRRIARILLTHGHLDHSAGAARLAELSGAPIQAADPAGRGCRGIRRR